MAMTSRERNLALGVGAIGVLFALQTGFNKIQTSISDRQDRVDAAFEELETVNRTVDYGVRAAEKIEYLNAKSLPSNSEALVAQYNRFLVNIAEETGLENIQTVNPRSAGLSPKSKAFTGYEFKLIGKCTTEQALTLMAKFYEADYLHRIKQMNFKPNPKQLNEFEVTLTSQALSLAKAPAKKEPPVGDSGRLAMSAEEYQRKIMTRNPFAPPNQAPKFVTGTRHEIERGDRWSLRLEAEDPEKQGVEFELVSTELPDGMEFNNGELKWRPDETGSFEVTVKAKDKNWSSEAIEQKLVLNVVDPPKEEPKVEEPKFDVASQAFVTAVISGRNNQVWIRSRTSGELLFLTQGDEFELGSIKAKVVEINPIESFAELETNGMRWTIGMDDSLADAYKRSQVD